MDLPDERSLQAPGPSPKAGRMGVALVPGLATPLAQRSASAVLDQLAKLGHSIQVQPDATTELILTTAHFGEVLDWREALLFSTRRRFGLVHAPTCCTLIAVPPRELAQTLSELNDLISMDPGRRYEGAFAGLAADGWQVLYGQGRRGGPLLALIRLLQAQAKSLRIVLVVGEDRPIEAYNFNLVGAYPRTYGLTEDELYRDIALRLVAEATAGATTDHRVVGAPVPYARWRELSTPVALQVASRQLKDISFFAPMFRVAELVPVPSIGKALASHYSEGCYATWDPSLSALIATAAGSTRPFDKGDICEDDLAVITGLREDNQGAQLIEVEGKVNPLPSTEAVEMMAMDQSLPKITLRQTAGGDCAQSVPVMRSKLHGHLGIRAYDSRRIEYVAIPAHYQHYLVPCGSLAQALAVKHAFAYSEALRDPTDPRQIVFTVLPGHGIIIAEKWVATKAPFQVILEHLGAGFLEIESRVPQGLLEYVRHRGNRMTVTCDGLDPARVGPHARTEAR